MKSNPCPHCDGTGRQIDQHEFGAAMRRKRETLVVSLRTVADAMKISAPYLSDLERGNRAWNSELIAKFNLALKNA